MSTEMDDFIWPAFPKTDHFCWWFFQCSVTDFKLPTKLTIFLARTATEYMLLLSIYACLSIRPSVCHTGGSVKNGYS